MKPVSKKVNIRKWYKPEIASIVERVQLQKMTTLSATRAIAEIIELCMKQAKEDK